jgi:replicative DNA helicase
VPTPEQPRVHGHRIVSLRGVLQRLDGDVRAGRANGLRGIPTGFSPLDSYLHGGLRLGELLLLGGAQGVGKSTWALQVARHVAAGGHGRVLYVCYEHSEEFLLERLIAMESALAGDGDAIGVGDLRDLLAARAGAGGGDQGGSATCWPSSARPGPCCSGWPTTRSGCSWSRRGR